MIHFWPPVGGPLTSLNRQAKRSVVKRFVFLVQEYESGFYPFGSLFTFADEAYTFPHYALFSTELLREFFPVSGYGVYGSRMLIAIVRSLKMRLHRLAK